jgi:hypothetical protein
MHPTDDSGLEISATDQAALGSLQSVHPAASGIHKVNIAIASIFTVLLAGPAILFLILEIKNPGKGNIIGLAIFGGMALLPAIGLFVLIRKLRWRLYLFDNGFVFARGYNRVVLWDDVKYFYEQQDVVAGIRADRWLRFVLANGQRFTIDSSYKDFVAFNDAVRDGVTQSLLARAAAAFPKGQSIPFGKLAVSQTGLEKDGDVVQWGDVHSISIELRFNAFAVVVFQRDPLAKVEWYARPIPQFANVNAFLALARQFTTVIGPPKGS